jgi:hypothetical protein
LQRATQNDARRRDQNLLQRYPNEEAHRKARALALDDYRKAMKGSEERLALLRTERKPLMDEAEFYVNRPMPLLLKQQIDANDAATDALRTLMQNQQSELVRINALFDAELVRLKKLWGGAQPGSLGPLPAAGTATSVPQ